MIDYDKIAQAMYEAYRAESGLMRMHTCMRWAHLDALEKTAGIAAAKAAHQELKEEI